MPLHDRIRSVGIRLGTLAGRVNPDDWHEISALRNELATCAKEAEWLVNLRDTSIAEADDALATVTQPSSKKSGKAAKEGA